MTGSDNDNRKQNVSSIPVVKTTRVGLVYFRGTTTRRSPDSHTPNTAVFCEGVSAEATKNKIGGQMCSFSPQQETLRQYWLPVSVSDVAQLVAFLVTIHVHVLSVSNPYCLLLNGPGSLLRFRSITLTLSQSNT